MGGGGGCSTLELPEVINNYVTSPHNIHNYITLQKGDENTQTYQMEVVILISHQILINNSQKCVAARGENLQSDLGSSRVNTGLTLKNPTRTIKEKSIFFILTLRLVHLQFTSYNHLK